MYGHCRYDPVGGGVAIDDGCTDCPAGKHSDEKGETHCKVCIKSNEGINYYSSKRGVSECEVCDAGMFTTREASEDGAVRCEQVPEVGDRMQSHLRLLPRLTRFPWSTRMLSCLCE